MKALLGIVIMLHTSLLIFSQQKTDSSYTRAFSKENNIQVFPGYYRSRFSITGRSFQHSGYHFLGNTSAYAGFFFNYKWASLLMSPNIPGTSIDKRDRNIKSVQFQTFHFWHSWGGEINYSQFRGLLLKKSSDEEIVEKFPGINYTGANINLYYFPGHTHFSYLSSAYCSETQLKSAGSTVIMITPAYQQFRRSVNGTTTYPDSLSYKFISGEPAWVSLSGHYGYSYNFIFKQGLWYINPLFFLTTGLSEQVSESHRFYSLSGYQLRLNAGYNGKNCFFVFNGYYDNTSNRFDKAFLASANLDIALTFGLRFYSLHKKILGIL